MIPEDFTGAARRIDGGAPYLAAAQDLGCDLAAVLAVAEVETRGEPFLPDGRPQILFERHVFSRLTGRQHDARAPAISAPQAGGYCAAGPAQYQRLGVAMSLDRDAALKACSWGRFQIMGFNHARCGWSTAEGFVAAMCADELHHLEAFVGFVEAEGLAPTLRARDWRGFARRYNGPGFERNRYDVKLAAAYARHAGEAGAPLAVSTEAEAQIALAELGHDPGAIDGLWGPRTQRAAKAFLTARQITQIGAARGAALYAALQAALWQHRSSTP